MMGIVKTMDPQLEAIQTIDRNLAVNAGAGTGKTKVLTERFIYILEHGDLEEFKEVESIVAITFTNKATQEMIERIREEIKKKFHMGEKWKRFYRDLERANISTIHGFCAKILRENPIEVGIDPYFEILDDNISLSLLKESIVHVLDIGLERDKNVFKMMQFFDKDRIENIVEDFVHIYNKIRTVGMDMERVKQQTIDYIDSLNVRTEDIEEVKEILTYLMDNLSKRSKIYRLKSDPIWEEFNSGNYREDIFHYIEYIYENLGSSSKEVEKQNRLKNLLISILLGKEKGYLWLYEIVSDILIHIDMYYSQLKRELGGLDYDDLQILVLKLLENKDIRNKYQEKFRYFMIDEFQDTNELQKQIFYRLTSIDEPLDRENLFIVGDPKQSIYGFRGADIDVFYDVLHDIEGYGHDNIITLSKNYRSIDTIIEFINTIFTGLMDERYDGLLSNKISKNLIDVEIIEKEDMEKIDGIDNNMLANIYEAEVIAKRIESLVRSGEYSYGDFALLFRATTRSHIYEKILKDYNIPYYNSSSKRYFYRQEVIDIINAIKSISNPYDNIATIGFLRGPMIGVRDDTIYWLLRNREDNIYNTMLRMEEDPIIDDDEREKLQEAIDLMNYFLDVKDLYDVSTFVEKIVEKTLFIETLSSSSDGEQSVANIYKFIDMTRKYDRENNTSLEDYIDYLEERRLDSEQEGIIQSAKDDVVKIMTIHGSKGLQFPVVIIPEMARSIGVSHSTILFDKDIGLGIRAKDNRALYDILKERQDNRDKEEIKRVLYVAMTRAKSLLILGNQGGNRGFKSLIQDLIDENQYRLIQDIELSHEEILTSKSKDMGLLCQDKGYKDISVPDLYDIVNYNKKVFERYNISQYLVFRSCKRRFFMDYYWKLDADLLGHKDELETSGLSGVDRGNVVHRFCRVYRYGMDKESLLRDIVSSYGISYDRDVYMDLSTYIDNYLSDYSEDYNHIYSEKPFHIKLGDTYITGVIDRIVIKGDKIEILDFKTNRLWNKEYLVHYYEPQLQLYAYAVEKILGKKVNRADIFFLEDGEKKSVDISSEVLEKNIESIVEFIDYVRENKDIDRYFKTNYCDKKCPHMEFCNLI